MTVRSLKDAEFSLFVYANSILLEDSVFVTEYTRTILSSYKQTLLKDGDQEPMPRTDIMARENLSFAI